MISGAADRTLQRWDIPDKALWTLETDGKKSRSAAAAEAASLSGDEIHGEDDDSAAKKLTACRWKQPAPLVETAIRSVRAHEKDVNCVAISPTDAIVASASQDRTVRLWRAADLEPLGVLTGHKRGVWKVGKSKSRS